MNAQLKVIAAAALQATDNSAEAELRRRIPELRLAEKRLANLRRHVDSLRRRYRDENPGTIVLPTLEQLEHELGLRDVQ